VDGERNWNAKESLAWLCRERGVRTFAEIGVCRGWIPEGLLADRAIHIDAYYMIDPWQPYEDAAIGSCTPAEALTMETGDAEEWERIYQNVVAMAQRFKGRAVVMRMTSLDAAAGFEDGTLDCAYIDANHELESVLADIDAWLPKVREGGVICGHDFDILADVNCAVLGRFPDSDLAFLPDVWFRDNGERIRTMQGDWRRAIWYYEKP
jgi:hypothetical protein